MPKKGKRVANPSVGIPHAWYFTSLHTRRRGRGAKGALGINREGLYNATQNLNLRMPSHGDSVDDRFVGRSGISPFKTAPRTTWRSQFDFPRNCI